jgi:coenzyme F420-reducing hydrogenase gamma subunit
MKPTPGKKKTILFGKCMHQANKDNPDIQEMIAIKGCPPKPKSVYEALQKAGIEVDPSNFESMDLIPGKFLKRYEGKPEFDETFFKISSNIDG